MLKVFSFFFALITLLFCKATQYLTNVRMQDFFFPLPHLKMPFFYICCGVIENMTLSFKTSQKKFLNICNWGEKDAENSHKGFLHT